MIYQFENDEIKKCIRCPMWVFPEMATMPLCNLTGETIPKGSTPQDNDCPMVAISKTETASEPCDYCKNTDYLKRNLTFVDRYYEQNIEPKFCPNCGRRLD